MAYLDVAPMITALRVAPHEFALEKDRYRPGSSLLVHKPSKHKFSRPFENPNIAETECDCSLLSIKYEQSDALADAARQWQRTYWQPMLDALHQAGVQAELERARRLAWIKSRPAAALATVRAWFKPASVPACHDIMRRVEVGGDD